MSSGVQADRCLLRRVVELWWGGWGNVQVWEGVTAQLFTGSTRRFHTTVRRPGDLLSWGRSGSLAAVVASARRDTAPHSVVCIRVAARLDARTAGPAGRLALT